MTTENRSGGTVPEAGRVIYVETSGRNNLPSELFLSYPQTPCPFGDLREFIWSSLDESP
jgi:hypothetical protein